MKLACNYYKETMELLREGAVELDYVKFPALGFQYAPYRGTDISPLLAELREIKTKIPILLHGFGPQDYNLGAEQFRENFDEEMAAAVIEACGTIELSGHLAPDMGALSSDYRWEISKMNCVQNIEFLRKCFPNILHLALENMDGNPYVFGKKLGCFIDPNFIRETVEAADAEFLLDVSHAYSSALSLKMDLWDYIGRLPMERLYEIHINGWCESENNLMAHIAVSEREMKIIGRILEKFKKPEILTIEYGRMNDRMDLGIPLLKAEGGNDRAKNEICRQIEQFHDFRASIMETG